MDGRANRASAVTDTAQSHLLGGHNNGYHADPPLDALNSSGGSGETQTTTVSGLRFIKRDGWVFVSGYTLGSSGGTLGSKFRPPSTVTIPYAGPDAGNTIDIDSNGGIATSGSGDIQPTVYPASEA